MWVSYYLPGNRVAPPPGPRAGGIPVQGEAEQAIWPFPPWVGTRRRSKQFWSPSPLGGDPEEEQAIFFPFSHRGGDWDGGEDYSPKQASYQSKQQGINWRGIVKCVLIILLPGSWHAVQQCWYPALQCFFYTERCIREVVQINFLPVP